MLSTLKLSVKGIKRLLSISLVVGIIAAYTAYKGQDQVKDIARETLGSAFSDMEVQQGAPAGQQIILAYNEAMADPASQSFIKLYSMVRLAHGGGNNVVRFPSMDSFPSPKIESMFAYNVNQLSFVERPIISGAWIFLLVTIASYLLITIWKAAAGMIIWGIRKGRNRKESKS